MIDHLEHFFNSVRACLGRDNNPTTVLFTASFKKLLMGATNKSKYGNCLSQDHLDIMTYPIKTDEAVNIISSDYDLDEMDSWVDVYERGLNLESDFKANVSTYIGGYIQRKLEANYPCVYCKDFLESCTERHTCDLIDKKDLGGLVRPSLDVNSVVNVADKLLTQLIKETNITL